MGPNKVKMWRPKESKLVTQKSAQDGEMKYTSCSEWNTF